MTASNAVKQHAIHVNNTFVLISETKLGTYLTFGVRAVMTEGVKTPGIFPTKLLNPIIRAEYLHK